MRPRTFALAPLEVAVGGGGHALALARRLAVHPHAHRAAGLPPLEAGLDEDTIEPLGLGGALDEPRARHDPRRHDGAVPLHHPGGRAQVLEPTIGAGADEDAIDLDLGERRAGVEPHVRERALHALAARGVTGHRWIGHAPRDGQGVLRTGSPGDGRRDRARGELYFAIERGPGIARQRPPGGERRAPRVRSEEHTSELQSQSNLVCRLLLEKKKKKLMDKYLTT